jgi:hypothetical protein
LGRCKGGCSDLNRGKEGGREGGREGRGNGVK